MPTQNLLLQNLHQSLRRCENMTSPDGNHELNYAKTFSIRQYTLSCRQKNIFHCWPFPDKYLILCRNHGVMNVLPPIIHHSHSVHLINSKSAAKESNSCREICHSSMISHDVSSDMLSSQMTTTLHSYLDVGKSPFSSSVDCLRTSRKNDRRRKGKQKKRWMVDILAVAKPCSLVDNVYEMNRENADTKAAGFEKGLRGNIQEAIVEHSFNSDLAEDCSNIMYIKYTSIGLKKRTQTC